MLQQSTLFSSSVSEAFLEIKIVHIKFQNCRFAFLDFNKQKSMSAMGLDPYHVSLDFHGIFMHFCMEI